MTDRPPVLIPLRWRIRHWWGDWAPVVMRCFVVVIAMAVGVAFAYWGISGQRIQQRMRTAACYAVCPKTTTEATFSIEREMLLCHCWTQTENGAVRVELRTAPQPEVYE